MLRGRGRHTLTTSPISSHHLKYPLLQWGHNHFHTEGQTSPETQGDKLQDTTHSTWRCRTDSPLIPHLRTPAQEPRRQRTLLEGGEFWALSYTRSLPPSPLPPFLPTLSHKRMTHWNRPKLATTPPLWRLIPEKTQHPPVQTSLSTTDVHTDTNQSTKITFFKSHGPSLTVSGRIARHACWHENNTSHCATLADAVPTDPIDDSHPESSCSQSHWSQHETTDEDKTLLTTPSSTLRAQSGPSLVSPPMCFLTHGIQLLSLALSPHLLIFPPLIFWQHASLFSWVQFFFLNILKSLEPV